MTAKGTPYTIEDLELDECPVSYVTAESKALVELHGRMQRVKEGTGAALFGLDSSTWPAWWYDAIAALEVQRILENNARVRAETEEMKREHGAI